MGSETVSHNVDELPLLLITHETIIPVALKEKEVTPKRKMQRWKILSL